MPNNPPAHLCSGEPRTTPIPKLRNPPSRLLCLASRNQPNPRLLHSLEVLPTHNRINNSLQILRCSEVLPTRNKISNSPQLLHFSVHRHNSPQHKGALCLATNSRAPACSATRRALHNLQTNAAVNGRRRTLIRINNHKTVCLGIA